MSTHGILNPSAGRGRFTLDRIEPSKALAAIVERYWIVRWDLRAAPPFVQETLPHPNVNLVVGTHRPGVHGVGTQRFAAELDGRGWAFGVKFRPGGFFPLYRRDVSELTGMDRPIADVFGADGAALEAEALSRSGDASSVDLFERFIAERAVADANVELASRAVDLARSDPSMGRADALAARAGLTMRTLERLFQRYVGVSPKWVIRRHRVPEACERVAAGIVPRWSELAHDLGYADQSHFIREFKTQVGCTPQQYAARCAKTSVTAAAAHLNTTAPLTLPRVDVKP